MTENSSEPKCPGYSHAPHTADEMVIAKGRSLEEAFEQAAIGVYEIITNTSKVAPRIEREIIVEGFDLYNLLYRWIEELLILTDSEGLVFSKFQVEEIEKKNEEEYLLKAKAWGERFDPNQHEHRTIVKAMTYAQMDIRKENGCWRVQFVVDI